MNFQNPLILLLAPVVLALIFYVKKRRKGPAIRFSSGTLLVQAKPSLKLKLNSYLVFVRMLAVFLFLLALARPRSVLEETRTFTEGIDIVLALDTSTSMLAEDFTVAGRRMNRLDAVKEVVKDFITKRPNDRMAMVIFAGKAYTVCPLTLDHGWLLTNLDRVQISMVQDGTAIGSGVLSSLNRLKDTKAKDKVIILLTDGRNNAGKVSPPIAAEAATALGVKIYTIGVGTEGFAPYPVEDAYGRTVYTRVKIDLDEALLRKIAAETDARYYRATDLKGLRDIYNEIDRLETYAIEEKGYMEYKELFPVFLIPGLVLLFLEIILGNTILRKIP